jgi:hypothetical protein
MSFHRWLQKLFDSPKAGSFRTHGGPARQSAPCRRRHVRRLAVDSFEDRLVPASFTAHDASLIEGNDGTTNAVVMVSLSEASNRPVSVAYSTADGSALAGSDYLPVSGRLNFTKGQTSKTILIPVMGDTDAEPDEYFFVNLSSPKKATIADGQAMVTIDDGDPTIGIQDMSITEGNFDTSVGTFIVTLSGESAVPVIVNYATADGSALAGSDYEAVTGSVTFDPGQTSKEVAVVVYGDRLAEPDQNFVLNLIGSTGAEIADSQGVGTILNDEPLVSITGSSQVEGDSGISAFDFTLTLSAASSDPILVEYATADGSASADSDYQAASGTLTIPANETSYTMSVLVNGDEDLEYDESFAVNLGSGAQAWATIQNDEDGVFINIDDAYVWEDDYGSTYIGFNVWLSGPSTETVTVDFTMYDGWATGGWDYVPFSGTLTFDPGVTSQTIWVEVLGDLDYEGDEYFSVNLSNNTGNSLIDVAWGTGWIYDNDYYYWW